MKLLKDIEVGLGFFVAWIVVVVICFASNWFDCYVYVLQNQWIKLPTTHYEAWQYLFAPQQSWAWLWL